jgi:hypothetical protein
MILPITENTSLSIVITNSDYISFTTGYATSSISGNRVNQLKELNQTNGFYFNWNKELKGKYPENFAPSNLAELIDYLIAVQNQVS